MNGRCLIFTVLIILLLCGCVAQESLKDICPQSHRGIACELPFEVLYSHRPEVEGRLVSLDGILVLGIAPEPPGKNKVKVLLFPSSERARSCNFSTAVEVLVSSSKGLGLEPMQEGVGYAVNIAGELSSSAEHWLAIEPVNDISLQYIIDSDVGSCLVSPPPILPEPE